MENVLQYNKEGSSKRYNIKWKYEDDNFYIWIENLDEYKFSKYDQSVPLNGQEDFDLDLYIKKMKGFIDSDLS
ncbi:hypothetical protein SAMN04487775_101513 [Treponema bryantii]|uniref:Uncharacterized protein n=1 Tax=Treponema bryantii TaxID=163 RepID=A0A1I3ID44_9SPIR|nr:hypothetical protein [Treponema bryantii]SFI45856.1 hypothetical protein SAMN04487775_101513 [Treponema bryantii]